MSWLLGLFGCVSTPPAPTAWVAPFDGQTAVAEDFTPTIDIESDPIEGWPLDLDLIRVVDLNRGVLVPGWVVSDDTAIWFEPDAPWAPESDFAWSVEAPAEQPRGPSSVFPPLVVGTASFSTRVDLELVAASTADVETVCALWSRPLDLLEVAEWEVAVDGVEVGPWTAAELDDPAAERGLVGPGLSCVRASGQTLRLTRDETVLSLAISTLDPDTIVRELRRWSP